MPIDPGGLVPGADLASQRAALGLAIGTDVQAFDSALASLANLSTAANTLPYFSGSKVVAGTTLSPFARTFLDDADAATVQATLGLVIGTNVQAYDAELAALAGLISAADRLPYFTGSGTAALATFSAFARTFIDDADAATVRSTLGLVIGTNVQAYSAGLPIVDIIVVIDGGGAAITTGVKQDLEVPFACTVLQSTLLVDVSGSIVVNVWKDTYANFPPTVAGKITGSAPPTISSATKAQDATLTGWTTSISAGDLLRFNVDSCATITRATLCLKVQKT
jgi:hypothetical protein